MKVAKFGGSSVASASQIRKVGKIITDDPNRKFIVVSAPGKRSDTDTKITDLLIQIGKLHILNEPLTPIYDVIVGRFKEITSELHLNEHVLLEIKESLDKAIEKTIHFFSDF